MFFPGSSPLLRASSILFPCWRIGTSHGCARGLRLDSMQSASELSSPPSQCGQESNSGSCKPPQCVDEQPWDVKHQAEQHVGMYWKRREEKQDQLPQICAVPKQKVRRSSVKAGNFYKQHYFVVPMRPVHKMSQSARRIIKTV